MIVIVLVTKTLETACMDSVRRWDMLQLNLEYVFQYWCAALVCKRM